MAAKKQKGSPRSSKGKRSGAPQSTRVSTRKAKRSDLGRDTKPGTAALRSRPRAAKPGKKRWTVEDELAAQANTLKAIESAATPPENEPNPDLVPCPCGKKMYGPDGIHQCDSATGNSEQNNGAKPKLPPNFETSIRPFQWKPKQSGNPNGRPKKTPLTDAYRQVLDQFIPEVSRATLGRLIGIELPDKTTFAQAIALNVALVAATTTKDAARAAMEVANRTEGKVPLPITGGKGGPVEVILAPEERRERLAAILNKARRA